jgi:hypothetical protein
MCPSENKKNLEKLIDANFFFYNTSGFSIGG